MENQILTIEQMKHLKELGYDVNESSVYWARISHGWMELDNLRGSWFVSLQKEFMEAGFASYEVVPTLTLQDILDRLPPQVNVSQNDGKGILVLGASGVTHVLTINRDREYCTIGYRAGNSYIRIGMGNTFLEAAYKALCDLLERGLIHSGDE